MITNLKRVSDKKYNTVYWKLKIRTNIKKSLTDYEIFDLEEIIETYLNNIEKQ